MTNLQSTSTLIEQKMNKENTPETYLENIIVIVFNHTKSLIKIQFNVYIKCSLLSLTVKYKTQLYTVLFNISPATIEINNRSADQPSWCRLSSLLSKRIVATDD